MRVSIVEKWERDDNGEWTESKSFSLRYSNFDH